MTGAALLLTFLCGFLLALALRAWSDRRDALELPAPEAAPAPSTVLSRARPVVRHVLATTWVQALQKDRGRALKALEVEATLEANRATLDRNAEAIARYVASIYLEALADVRRAAARHSGLDPALIDQAVLIALQRDARSRAELDDED